MDIFQSLERFPLTEGYTSFILNKGVTPASRRNIFVNLTHSPSFIRKFAGSVPTDRYKYLQNKRTLYSNSCYFNRVVYNMKNRHRTPVATNNKIRVIAERSSAGAMLRDLNCIKTLRY